MKKVFIIYSGAKVRGGIETYLENLFGSYDREKLNITLVSMGVWDLTESLSKKGDNVIVLPKKRIRLKTVSDVVTLAEKEGVNLLVSQGIVANYYARRVALKSNIPLLTTIHSDMEYEYPNEINRLAYKLSDRIVRKHTTRFLTVSNCLKEMLIKTGISANKISVIYNGIDTELFKPSGKTVKRKTYTTIGSVGRLHYIKGYHNLIESMNYLRDLPVKLVIYGEGEERKALEELIARNSLNDIVSLPGYGKDFDNIDIYVQPSLMEGFGLTVIEAMAMSKPVIVTPVGSLPEIVTDTKTGLITADTNPESLAIMIKTLVKNPELAKELALAGHDEVLEKYTLEKWIKETERVYLETAK